MGTGSTLKPMQYRITLTFVLLLLLPVLASAGPPSVPPWFVSDTSDPYAIFSAWKNLSSREAAVYLHDGWRVLGGQLVDEKGNAMGLTRLSGSGGDSSSRGEGADLVTDKNGYFLIYGPQSIDVDYTVTDQP